MKKQFITAAICLLAMGVTHAQTKIKDGTVAATATTPNANAVLDIESSNKGLLMPRVALTSTTSFAPLSAHTAGMLIFNTAITGVAPTNVVPGIYMNDGTQWVLMQTPSTLNLVPPGSVFHLATTTLPTGYLECNGAAVSRTVYATLFATIGTTYGAGNGSTTFTLPDLRGEFIRGYDNGRGADESRVFGSWQVATAIMGDGDGNGATVANLNFSGAKAILGYENDAAPSNTVPLWMYTASMATFSVTTTGVHSDGSAQVDGDFARTRPRNVALLPIIKY